MKITRLFIFILSLIVFPLKLVLGQANNNYGTLSGTISDIQTATPLPGANIILMRTLMGASSDLKGNFTVKKVPAGKYDVKATMMGYKSETVSVTINPGEQTNIEFKLKETVIESPTLIVTASKKAQSFQDVSNSVSIISLKEIERRNKPYLDEVLEYIPGVNMMSGDVNIRGSSGFSLGAGSRVLMLVDGIPMMPGDSGDIKWDIVPPSQIERVEIVKGAGSALYGSQALGGVINIITKEPELKPVTRFQISAGIYDKPYYREWNWTDKLLTFSQIDITHSRSWEKFSMVLSGGRRETTGYQQNGWKNNYNLLAKFNYKFNTQSTFSLQSNLSAGDYGEIFQWRNQSDPYEMPVPAIGDWVNSNKYSINAVYRQLLNSKFTYKIRTSYFHNNFKHYHHDNDDSSKANKLGMEIQADYMPDKINTITMGVEGTYDHTTSAVWGDHHAYNWAGYIQDDIKFYNSLSLTIGGRFDYHYVDIGVEENQFNPKLGLNFRPRLYTTLRASIGRGFRAPTLAEMFTSTYASGFKVIPNPELKTESAWSYEIGFNQIISDKLILDLALFQNTYENFVEPYQDDFVVQFINISNARIRGLELSVQGNVWQRLLGYNLGYTYMDPIDLDTKETLAYRPRHLFVAGLSLSYSNFEVGMDYRYISRLEKVSVSSQDDRVPQKVGDFRISTNISGLRLALNVNNLFQYNYTQIEKNIAPPRHVVFTVNREF